MADDEIVDRLTANFSGLLSKRTGTLSSRLRKISDAISELSDQISGDDKPKVPAPSTALPVIQVQVVNTDEKPLPVRVIGKLEDEEEGSSSGKKAGKKKSRADDDDGGKTLTNREQFQHVFSALKSAFQGMAAPLTKPLQPVSLAVGPGMAERFKEYTDRAFPSTLFLDAIRGGASINVPLPALDTGGLHAPPVSLLKDVDLPGIRPPAWLQLPAREEESGKDENKGRDAAEDDDKPAEIEKKKPAREPAPAITLNGGIQVTVQAQSIDASTAPEMGRQIANRIYRELRNIAQSERFRRGLETEAEL